MLRYRNNSPGVTGEVVIQTARDMPENFQPNFFLSRRLRRLLSTFCTAIDYAHTMFGLYRKRYVYILMYVDYTLPSSVYA